MIIEAVDQRIDAASRPTSDGIVRRIGKGPVDQVEQQAAQVPRGHVQRREQQQVKESLARRQVGSRPRHGNREGDVGIGVERVA